MSASFTVSGKGAQAPGNEGTGTPRFDIQSRPVTDLTNRDELLHVGAGDIVANVLEVTKTQAKALNGSASLPSWAFINSPTTGIFRAGTDSMSFATAATLRMNINASGLVTITGASLTTGIGTFTAESVHNGGIDCNGSINVSNTIIAADGTAALPSYTFANSSVGMHNLGGGEDLFFSTSGATQCQIDSVGSFRSGSGSVASPGLTFLSDTNTGMSNSIADHLDFSTGGTHAMRMTSSQRVEFAGGSEANPSLNFGRESSDTDTGMFRTGANGIGFALGGSKVLSLSGTSVIAVSNYRFDDGGGLSGLTSNGANAVAITVAGTDVIAFTAGESDFTGDVKMNSLPTGVENEFLFIDTDSGANQWRIHRNTSSSRRYKENIKDGLLVDGNELLNIKLVSWDYKQSYLDNPKNMVVEGFDRYKHWGAIAEQVYKHIPELVSKRDGKIESVKLLKKDYLLIDLCQKQQKQIDLLNKEMKSIKRKLAKK